MKGNSHSRKLRKDQLNRWCTLLNCPQGNTIHRECDWMEIIRIFIPLWQVSTSTESVWIVPSTHTEELFALRCTTNVFVLCTKMPHIMHTCDNFCIKSIFIYNKGSILRNVVVSLCLLMLYYLIWKVNSYLHIVYL